MPISKGAKIAIFVTVAIVVIAGSLVTYFMLIKRKPQTPSPSPAATALPINLNGKWMIKDAALVGPFATQFPQAIIKDMVDDLLFQASPVIFIDTGATTINTKAMDNKSAIQEIKFDVVTRNANLIELKLSDPTAEKQAMTSVDGKTIKMVSDFFTLTLKKVSDDATGSLTPPAVLPPRCPNQYYCDGKYVTNTNRVSGSSVCSSDQINNVHILKTCNGTTWEDKGPCSSYIDQGVTYQCK